MVDCYDAYSIIAPVELQTLLHKRPLDSDREASQQKSPDVVHQGFL